MLRSRSSVLDMPPAQIQVRARLPHPVGSVGPLVNGGRVVHRRGITNITGLHFIGLAWQHTRGSALFGFVKHDTAYLADRLTAGPEAT